MRLTVTPTGAQLLVRSYAAGRLRIGERELLEPVIVSAETLHTDLRPRHPEEIELGDLEPVFALRPEVVIVGWAGGQLFMPASQRRWFLERGIGVEVMELGAACRTYNVLLGDGRAVVAILFP
jgi:uncharacterized protein